MTDQRSDTHHRAQFKFQTARGQRYPHISTAPRDSRTTTIGRYLITGQETTHVNNTREHTEHSRVIEVIRTINLSETE
jgi:hypothetical protein